MRLRHGLLERIQIDHHHVDVRDVVLFQGFHVLRKIAPRQNAAVHFRMERLDAAVQHFGKAGVVGHFGDLDAVVGQQFGGAAGGQDIDAHRGQRAREFENAGFIGDGDEGLFDHGKANEKLERNTGIYAQP